MPRVFALMGVVAGSISLAAAALLSSSMFATAFYPLHRVKILLQTQDSNPLVMNGQACDLARRV